MSHIEILEGFIARRERAVREIGYVMPGLTDKSVPVTPVPKHDFVGGDPAGQARTWAKEHLRGTYSMMDENGDVLAYEITGESINKFLSNVAVNKSKEGGANLGIQIAVLKVLPEVISNTIQTEIHPNYRKIGDGRSPAYGYSEETLIHRRYGAVNVDGMVGRVKITLKEVLTNKRKNANTSNKVYSYEVTKIEMLDIRPSISLDSTQKDNSPRIGTKTETPDLWSGVSLSSDTRQTKLSLTGTANIQQNSELPKIDLDILLQGVTKSYEKTKLLLDESRKEDIRINQKQNIMETQEIIEGLIKITEMGEGVDLTSNDFEITDIIRGDGYSLVLFDVPEHGVHSAAIVYDDNTMFVMNNWQGWRPTSIEEIKEATWLEAYTLTEAIMLDGLPRLLFDETHEQVKYFGTDYDLYDPLKKEVGDPKARYRVEVIQRENGQLSFDKYFFSDEKKAKYFVEELEKDNNVSEAKLIDQQPVRDVKREYHSNGQLEYEWHYANGELDGISKAWYSTGKLAHEYKYDNGVLRSRRTHFMEGGLFKEENYNEKGEKHGVQREWHKNGKLACEEHYENGLRDGIYEEWLANGEKWKKGYYINDKQDGEWIIGDGKYNYENGKLEGDFFLRHGDGAYTVGWYENNRLEGPVNTYLYGSLLVETTEYKEGVQHGPWKKWYDDGKPFFVATCEEGKLEGVYKEWHENGQLARECTYKQGKVDGVEKLWYENGNLMCEYNCKEDRFDGVQREYNEDGKLQKELNYVNGKREVVGEKSRPLEPQIKKIEPPVKKRGLGL